MHATSSEPSFDSILQYLMASNAIVSLAWVASIGFKQLSCCANRVAQCRIVKALFSNKPRATITGPSHVKA